MTAEWPAAEAVAITGVEVALKGVPIGSFGKFVTVDRGEIEGFRSIRTLMREYDSEPAPRPLNIAVFGPPGAGKSFGVKAVVKSALDADRIEDLTFNLSLVMRSLFGIGKPRRLQDGLAAAIVSVSDSILGLLRRMGTLWACLRRSRLILAAPEPKTVRCAAA